MLNWINMKNWIHSPEVMEAILRWRNCSFGDDHDMILRLTMPELCSDEKG